MARKGVAPDGACAAVMAPLHEPVSPGGKLSDFCESGPPASPGTRPSLASAVPLPPPVAELPPFPEEPPVAALPPVIELPPVTELPPRSEERRVGKECRCPWSGYH